MSTFDIVLLFVVVLFLGIEIVSYRSYTEKVKLFNEAVSNFDKRAIEYESSFNDYATTIILVTENVSKISDTQNEMIQHLTEIETLVSLHSEVLETKTLDALIHNRLPKLTLIKSE